MTRIRLNWLGRVGNRRHPKESFRIALMLSMTVVAVDGVWYYLPRIRILDLVLTVVNAVIFLYFCANVWRARCHIRRRFSIPGQGFNAFVEDAFSVLFCSCCSVMQLSRQTADYDSYNAQLCTSVSYPGIPRLTTASC
jgi:Cys-rich protein (TIGR01571 family)